VVKRHHFGGGPKSHGSMFQITGFDWVFGLSFARV